MITSLQSGWPEGDEVGTSERIDMSRKFNLDGPHSEDAKNKLPTVILNEEDQVSSKITPTSEI